VRHLLPLVFVACVGTTGGAIVDFPAVVVTVPEAKDFTNDRGWHVVLAKARLHIGAVYLDSALPVSGAQSSNCILPGTYVAEVTSGLDIDLLSPAAQPFPDLGHGTTTPARAAQVWLTAGDVNLEDDSTPMLVIEGIADRAGDVRPFSGTIVIGKNRAPTTPTPGASPICKQRIVSPIPTSVGVEKSGTLRLTIDARQLFVNVDFGGLEKSGATTYVFSDEPGSDGYTQPSINLYENLHSGGALYAFSWQR
jgi:hypothetical protein